MNKVLVVVDVQNDFVDGSLGTPQAQAIIPSVKAKIEEHQQRGDLIFFTRDTHYEDYLETQEGKNLPVEHCIVETHGWMVYDNLDRYGYHNINQYHIDKETFGWLDWKDALMGLGFIDEIELIGLCTGICVVSNALILKAIYPETRITVDASCCACVSEESHRAALLTMKMCQVNIINEG